MRRSFFRYVWMAAAVLLMAACSTSRHAEKSSMIGTLKGEEYLERLIENAPRWQAVTGKVAFSLDMGSKGTTSLSDTGHRPSAQALCGDFIRNFKRHAAY